MTSCSSCSAASTCSSATASGGKGACPDLMAVQERAMAARLSHIRYKIFVMSGKGGVGKSSVTVNMAAALAQRDYHVGILDVDIHGPSVPNLLTLQGGVEIDEATGRMLPVAYNDHLSVISMDSLLRDKDEAVLWRGPKKNAAIRQFIGDVQWGDLDFLFIDSPPGTGDEHMTVLQAIPDALCVVVTTPQELSLADVRKTMNFLQHANAAVLGVVENMRGLVCPHCHTLIPLFGTGGGEALAARYGVAFLGAIPLDPVAAEAADKGVPVVFLKETSAAKTAFLHLADALATAVENSLEALAGSQ